jgi:alginate O-acetyltransferase complex protein AlgI
MLLSIHRVWKLSRVTLHQLLAWPITVVAVILGWVLFRSKSVEGSLAYYMALVGLGDQGESVSISLRDIPGAFWAAAVLLLIWDERLPVKGRFAALGAVGSGLLVWLCVSSGGEISEFLYFQF